MSQATGTLISNNLVNLLSLPILDIENSKMNIEAAKAALDTNQGLQTPVLKRLSLFDCLLCGMSTGSFENLCHNCLTNLPYSHDPCICCGSELETDSEIKICGSCSIMKPVFNRCVPAMSYASPVNRLLSQFKFSGDFAAGSALAQLLAATFIAHYSLTTAPDFIIPIPLHRSRLQHRGFNQALEIARVLHKQSGVPIVKNALVRVKNTMPQTELGKATLRKSNLKGAFAFNPSALEAGNYHIALVDDVMTTGATASEAARALFQSGAAQVDCFCVARANS